MFSVHFLSLSSHENKQIGASLVHMSSETDRFPSNKFANSCRFVAGEPHSWELFSEFVNFVLVFFKSWISKVTKTSRRNQHKHTLTSRALQLAQYAVVVVVFWWQLGAPSVRAFMQQVPYIIFWDTSYYSQTYSPRPKNGSKSVCGDYDGQALCGTAIDL